MVPSPVSRGRPHARLGLLSPLRERDFALLWTGMTVSLLGDGIYFVAIAWQAYALSNAPTALSVVGVAWTLPTVVFLLVGGALSDRIERARPFRLIPVSFAITGPTAEALGPRTTLLAAGCLGASATIAFLAVPGLRTPERMLAQRRR